MPIFLHVGCGLKHKDMTTPGFNLHEWKEVRLDIDESVRPDIIGTMLDMSAVESESIDAIYSSHNIEHLYPSEVPLALREFLRVLKPSGYAVITCPDIQEAAKMIVDDKLLDTAYISSIGPVTPFDILYSHRLFASRDKPHMAHYCGFTLKTLTDTLTDNGFATVAGMRRPVGFDLWVVASKSEMTREQICRIAGEHFPG